jgi:hypothetical protein
MYITSLDVSSRFYAMRFCSRESSSGDARRRYTQVFESSIDLTMKRVTTPDFYLRGTSARAFPALDLLEHAVSCKCGFTRRPLMQLLPDGRTLRDWTL